MRAAADESDLDGLHEARAGRGPARPRWGRAPPGLCGARDGEGPELKVWMRTHAKKKPVAKKSFLRTVCHEVCHHLDFFVFDIDPSFHTTGFFRREAAL